MRIRDRGRDRARPMRRRGARWTSNARERGPEGERASERDGRSERTTRASGAKRSVSVGRAPIDSIDSIDRIAHCATHSRSRRSRDRRGEFFLICFRDERRRHHISARVANGRVIDSIASSIAIANAHRDRDRPFAISRSTNARPGRFADVGDERLCRKTIDDAIDRASGRAIVAVVRRSRIGERERDRFERANATGESREDERTRRERDLRRRGKRKSMRGNTIFKRE